MAGDYFGEMALAETAPGEPAKLRSATIVCTIDSRLGVLTKDEYLGLRSQLGLSGAAHQHEPAASSALSGARAQPVGKTDDDEESSEVAFVSPPPAGAHAA